MRFAVGPATMVVTPNPDAVLQRARDAIKTGCVHDGIIRDLVLLVEQSQVYREALVRLLQLANRRSSRSAHGWAPEIAAQEIESALRDADVKAGRKP